MMMMRDVFCFMSSSLIKFDAGLNAGVADDPFHLIISITQHTCLYLDFTSQIIMLVLRWLHEVQVRLTCSATHSG